MQKQKENLFREKFRLLNSQEHNEDIKWTSSSSSEYENTSCNEKFFNLDKSKTRKRKRKRKVPKNLSNLDITIIDSSKDRKSDFNGEKSPILVSKCAPSSVSPILMTNRFPPHNDSSPILCSKSSQPKSPIITLKYASPKHIGRVRKKLYNENISIKQEDSSIDSPVQNTSRGSLFEVNKSEDSPKLINNNTGDSICIVSESNSMSTMNGSDSSVKSRLMEKVKTFFDSHFSSDNTSQNISIAPTPSECSKSEEVDILTCKTQSVPFVQTMKLENTSADSTYLDQNSKKVKYKKGGLAYRMNVLLKKQNAHISLWQHERFLAQNSNFVIPKKENLVFQVQSVDFKYGCYLLNAVDLDSAKFLILINCKYVNSSIFVESVFKLYEPYKILPFDEDFNMIINVCKFECMAIK
ncbi:uncharacterized protein LOC142985157 [Anticarsia gemmatalis]|uniref:uncharacterized protein LOC142985157 n=1 Tax=Anticarsia gemmatalis TaxID=129554 RepID=UPI003F76A712